MNQIAEQPGLRSLKDHSAALHTLFLERSTAEAELNLLELQQAGFHCESRIIASRTEFLDELKRFSYDLVISGHDLLDWTGQEALEMLRNLGNSVPFIFVTVPLGEEMAVECFRKGASDYVLKDRRSDLPSAVKRALDARAIQDAHLLMVQALHVSEESSQFLFSQNPLPMCVFDVETLDFLELNQAAIDRYGFARHEFLQMRLSDLHPPQEIPRLMSALQEYSQGAQPADHWHHRLKNGSLSDVELQFHPLESGGHSAGLLVAQDCSRQRALEEQLQRAQKFEVIAKLSEGIAHDFNNVMGAILGWADIGEEQAAPIDAKLAVYFRKIHGQCERVTALLDQLRAFSRSGGPEAVDLDLNQSVRNALEFAGSVIGADIEIRKRLAKDLVLVRADPALIGQMLINMCIHARDFMDQGGTLSIETGNAHFSAQDCRPGSGLKAGNFAQVSVTNSTNEMDFSAVRLNAEKVPVLKDAQDAADVGLATVDAIVLQQGGFIVKETVSGQGRRFRVFIPAAEKSKASKIEPLGPAPYPVSTGTETILIAEDHDGIREMASTLLRSIGHTVLLAKDGREAVALFSVHMHSVDLVVLNLTMPHCGGEEAYQAIKALRPNVPVLFSTGRAADDSRLAWLSESGVPVLHSPFTPAVLCRKIRTALDQAKVDPQGPGASSEGTHEPQ